MFERERDTTLAFRFGEAILIAMRNILKSIQIKTDSKPPIVSVLYSHCLPTTHCPSSNTSSLPPSFILTGPPSSCRSLAEYVDSSRWLMLGRESDLRGGGFLGVRNDVLENSGILVRWCALKRILFGRFVSMTKSTRMRRPQRARVCDHATSCSCSILGSPDRHHCLPALWHERHPRRGLELCQGAPRRLHVLVAVREQRVVPEGPNPSGDVATGEWLAQGASARL